MKHNEANIKIYYTRDYSRFNNITGNRMLNEAKIKKLIQDIENGFDMLRYCPIIVDKEMNVIDGQHRLHVARKIKSNIWYVITDKISLYEIAKMNSNTDKWKAQDFLNAYVTLKNPDYIRLQEFVDEHGISLSVAILLLEKGQIKAGGVDKTKDRFQAGAFRVECWADAIELMDLLKNFSDFPERKKRPFLHALDILRRSELCDWYQLVRKYKAHSDLLVPCSDAKGYLKILEDIYNMHARERKVIYK